MAVIVVNQGVVQEGAAVSADFYQDVSGSIAAVDVDLAKSPFSLPFNHKFPSKVKTDSAGVSAISLLRPGVVHIEFTAAIPVFPSTAAQVTVYLYYPTE